MRQPAAKRLHVCSVLDNKYNFKQQKNVNIIIKTVETVENQAEKKFNKKLANWQLSDI